MTYKKPFGIGEKILFVDHKAFNKETESLEDKLEDAVIQQGHYATDEVPGVADKKVVISGKSNQQAGKSTSNSDELSF